MKHLKNGIILSMIVAASLCAAVQTSYAQGWNDGPVVVYDQQNGRGNSQAFNVGEFRNDQGQFGSLRNDSASSVSVEPNFRVRFCESENRGGSGRCEEFGEGYHNLRYRNAASYIRVWQLGGRPGVGWGTVGGSGRRGVTVYDDRDYRGASQVFGPGRYLNSAGQLGAIRNDEASSVVVERGYRVRFCESEGNGNGSGRCDEYGEGRFNIRLNDEASYIEVRRIGGGWGTGRVGDWGNWGGGVGRETFFGAVVVYSDINQRGEQQVFDVGTFRNDRGELGSIRNDDAGSITVANGYRVRICDNEANGNGGGRCEEYGPGSRNLRYNDRMSYIRVWRAGF